MILFINTYNDLKVRIFNLNQAKKPCRQISNEIPEKVNTNQSNILKNGRKSSLKY